MKTALFQVKGLSFSYSLGEQRLEALKDVALEIEKGDFACLAGPSGSGKTTLLNVLGLIEPLQEAGDVRMDGQSFRELSERERNRLRRFRIGFIFQSFHLFPVLTAEENVEYFLDRQGVERAERMKRVQAALEAVGLWEHRAKRPLQMSGGQRQRVAVARALAKNPDVIIADEPTASLDQKTGREIMEILARLNRERGVSVILSSHDLMVHGFARRLIHLKDGQLC